MASGAAVAAVLKLGTGLQWASFTQRDTRECLLGRVGKGY
jgi:hypothetical protein